ncbi:MAG: hypothetical protein SNI87_06170 [Rikenellaceae bacterium]
MRTEFRTYNIYSIDELSTESQERAHQEWRDTKDYPYGSDNRKTLAEFEDMFELSVTNWSYDSCAYNYKFSSSVRAEIEEMSGLRLATYFINNHWQRLFAPKHYWKGRKMRASRVFVSTDCPLTGYCADFAILDPIYKFLKNPTEEITYHDLMNSCLDNFFKMCCRDVESTETMEYFIDESLANEWEYLEDGTLFN